MKNYLLFIVIFLAGSIFSFAYRATKNIDVSKHQNSEGILIQEARFEKKESAQILSLLNLDLKDNLLQAKWSGYGEDFKALNPHDLIVKMNRDLSILATCYIKNNCDISTSVIEKIIERELDLLKNLLKQHLKENVVVDWPTMMQVSRIDSVNIRALSQDLIVNYNQKNFGATEIIKLIKGYQGRERLELVVNMSKELLSDERKLFIQALKEILFSDDKENAFAIVERLPEMKLKEDEVHDLSASLCRFRNDHDWKKFEDIFKVISLQFKDKSFCQS